MTEADVTSAEAAAMLGIGVDRLCQLRRSGAIDLPVHRIEHHVPGWRRFRRPRFLVSDVQAVSAARSAPRETCSARDAVIVGAASAGVPYNQIAAALNVSLGVVSGVAINAGVHDRPKRDEATKRQAVAFARERGFEAAVARFGVSRRALFTWAKQQGEVA